MNSNSRQPSFFANRSRVMCSASSLATGTTALWKASSAISPAVERLTSACRPSSMGGSSKALAIIMQQELLPLDAQVGVGAAGEAQDLGLLLAAEHGDAAGALDLVLPPADEAVVLLGRGLVEPERVLHDGVAGEAAGIAVGGEELVDGLEGDLEAAQAERRVGARVQADVHELVVEQRDEVLAWPKRRSARDCA